MSGYSLPWSAVSGQSAPRCTAVCCGSAGSAAAMPSRHGAATLGSAFDAAVRDLGTATGARSATITSRGAVRRRPDGGFTLALVIGTAPGGEHLSRRRRSMACCHRARARSCRPVPSRPRGHAAMLWTGPTPAELNAAPWILLYTATVFGLVILQGCCSASSRGRALRLAHLSRLGREDFTFGPASKR